MQGITGLSLKELEKTLLEWGEPVFHARQIFSWIYKRGAADFEAMSDLSCGLRKRLKEKFPIFNLELIKKLQSEDGTKKFLLELNDGHLIEAVTIPAENRLTGCVSTQVGCKYNCRFCASGLLGFKRNLTSAEILGEILYLEKDCGHKLTHLVFMGIGEPLDNYENVLKAVRIINSPESLNIGARRITISTCGIIGGIKKLAKEDLQVELSISLHAPDEKARSVIMPVNKKYPLKDLIPACKEYINKTGRQITFEYVLVNGLNSDLPKAKDLVKILRSLRLAKVNLIPANRVKELNIEPPNKLEVLFFKNYLLRSGVNVTLRKPRGGDIEAACGQLRLRYEKN